MIVWTPQHIELITPYGNEPIENSDKPVHQCNLICLHEPCPL